ncbi:tRNA 5-methylaminomethyl-2-thiouridine synthase TusC [Pseudoalteromonas luteoviolacea B = ATCC 29581]|nr:tRNA 5-methylaminomethyl-2-thiouridine synthase TusC [Pseudoalteromonas luteoviolacea B = ATCC 29581]
MTKLLVISQSSPFSLSTLKDTLDMALIFAAVDADVSWLFTGSSVLSLIANQNPSHLGLKNQFKALKTLEIYDVDKLYVDEEQLRFFKISRNDLILDVKPIDLTQSQDFFAQFDKVVTF